MPRLGFDSVHDEYLSNLAYYGTARLQLLKIMEFTLDRPPQHYAVGEISRSFKEPHDMLE